MNTEIKSAEEIFDRIFDERDIYTRKDCIKAIKKYHNQFTPAIVRNGWISVEDSKPNTDSLLLTASGICIIGDWYKNGWRTHKSHWETVDGVNKLVSAYKNESITHWQPLPAPPNGKEQPIKSVQQNQNNMAIPNHDAQYEAEKQKAKELIAAGGCHAIQYWSRTDAERLCPKEYNIESDLEAPIYISEWVDAAKKAIQLIQQGIDILEQPIKSVEQEDKIDAAIEWCDEQMVKLNGFTEVEPQLWDILKDAKQYLQQLKEK